MKNQLLSILAVLVIFSCSNDSSVLKDPEQLVNQEAFKKGPKKGKADIIVFPSGDLSGITDANNIEDALNTLPEGGVLLMKIGTYYSNRTIEAPEGFNGTIKGSGKDKTKIIAVGDSGTPFTVAPPFGPTGFNNYPNESVFLFYNPKGSVNMNSLAITLSDDFVAAGVFTRGRLFTFITVGMSDNDADTNFNKLKLTGLDIPFPDTEASPAVGILVSGNNSTFPTFISGGTHRVTNSIISKIAVPPTAHYYLKNAEILLQGNTCFDVRQTQLIFLDGCDIIIKDNNLTAYDISAINLTQEGFPLSGETNTVEIKNNIITANGWVAIEIGPSYGDANFEVNIKNNQLENKGGGTFPGFPDIAVVGISEGNDNVIVKDNNILGNVPFGITQDSDYGSFKDNDFSSFNAIESDYKLTGDYNELRGVGTSTVIDSGVGNVIQN